MVMVGTVVTVVVFLHVMLKRLNKGDLFLRELTGDILGSRAFMRPSYSPDAGLDGAISQESSRSPVSSMNLFFRFVIVILMDEQSGSAASAGSVVRQMLSGVVTVFVEVVDGSFTVIVVVVVSQILIPCVQIAETRRIKTWMIMTSYFWS